MKNDEFERIFEEVRDDILDTQGFEKLLVTKVPIKLKLTERSSPSFSVPESRSTGNNIFTLVPRKVGVISAYALSSLDFAYEILLSLLFFCCCGKKQSNEEPGSLDQLN